MTVTTVSLSNLGSLIDQELGPCEPVSLDQAMVDLFARTTGDRQWIHVDVERARAELNGTIAHGYLVLSLVPLFVSRLIEITDVANALNYGLERVRFLSPVRPPATMTATMRIRSEEAKGAGVLMRSDIAVFQADAERPVCISTTLTLLVPGESRFGSFDP